MKKNYFWVGIAAGALIGAGASLLHKETRHQQLMMAKGLKMRMQSSNLESEEGYESSESSLKDRIFDLKELYEDNQDTIQNLVEDVKDLISALQDARRKM